MAAVVDAICCSCRYGARSYQDQPAIIDQTDTVDYIESHLGCRLNYGQQILDQNFSDQFLLRP
jgi:hypothetical protein